jgi:hypothetical protein
MRASPHFFTGLRREGAERLQTSATLAPKDAAGVLHSTPGRPEEEGREDAVLSAAAVVTR